MSMASDRVVIVPSALRRYVRRSGMNTVDMQARKLALRLQIAALSACDVSAFGANRGELDGICAAIDDAARRNGEIDDFVSDTTRRVEAADRVGSILGWAPVMVLGSMWPIYKGLVEIWRSIRFWTAESRSDMPTLVPPPLDLDRDALITEEIRGAEQIDGVKPGSPFAGDYYVSGGGFPTYGNGTLHTGVDIKPRSGAGNVHPIAPGRVAKVSYDEKGYGHYVIVEHRLRDGTVLFSLYAHFAKAPELSNEDLNEGQVTAETILGEMGSSGRSTGPHLHLEIYNKEASNLKGNDLFYGHAPDQVVTDQVMEKTKRDSLGIEEGATREDLLRQGWYDPLTVIKGETDWEFLPPSLWSEDGA